MTKEEGAAIENMLRELTERTAALEMVLKTVMASTPTLARSALEFLHAPETADSHPPRSELERRVRHRAMTMLQALS